MKTAPMQQRLETPTETDTHKHVYQKAVSDVNELKQHLIETWSATMQKSFIDQPSDLWQDCFNACLKAKSKHCTFAVMFLRNCHDF